MQIPEDFATTGRTKTFTAATIPAKLRARHSTKKGTWARITVTSGRLRLRLHAPVNEELVLDSSTAGDIAPELEHDVEPLDDATEFYVEFFREDGG